MKHELVQAASATDILLTEGVVLLGVALAFVILFRRLGLGAVLGYLIAGALVGPQGLGLVGGAESKLAIAEIGIVLLLFLVGLELKPQRLWRLKRDRSEEHTSELQSLMRISYAVFCLKKKNTTIAQKKKKLIKINHK